MKDNMYQEGTVDVIGPFDRFEAGTGAMALPLTRVADIGGRRGVVLPGSVQPAGWYRATGKRIVDIAFVLMTLPMSLPIILICAIALWLEGGQPFYRQERLGKGGKRFSILKLRTMSRDADQVLESYLARDPAMRAEWDTTQKLKNDPRITRVGAFLRSSSMDELPQLWNVLKGDMSVVGPRPMMPEQLRLYPNPRPYFSLRPGITGEWQVSDRNENSFAHRSTVDARYNVKVSFWNDMKILVQTAGVVLRRTGY